jgi:Calcineurin-like phosphoesterase
VPKCLFAIGDIHGCATALRTVIEAIDPRPGDTVIVLGEVIDWGPDSRDCVRQVIDPSNCCRLVRARGNHEEMLFAALESRSELRSWLDLGGEETLKSYPGRGGGRSKSRGAARIITCHVRSRTSGIVRKSSRSRWVHDFPHARSGLKIPEVCVPGLGGHSHCAVYHVPCPGLLLECRTRVGVVGPTRARPLSGQA